VARRRDIERLQSEVEELFADLWQLPHFLTGTRGFRPPVDCYRSTKRSQFVVFVELAGVDPSELTVAVERRELVISGERRRDREEGRVYQLMEIEDGPFERRIPLAPDVDAAGGNARYERGLLSVVFPLAKTRAPAGKVQIRVLAP
jgi:HSP20 family molecular chaperone IbpA